MSGPRPARGLELRRAPGRTSTAPSARHNPRAEDLGRRGWVRRPVSSRRLPEDAVRAAPHRSRRPRIGAVGLRRSRPGYGRWDEVERSKRVDSEGIGSGGAYRASPGHGVRASGLHARRGARPAAKHRPGNRRDRGRHRRRGGAEARSVRVARSVRTWMLPVICPPGRAETDLTPAQRSVRRGPDPRSACRSILDDLRGSAQSQDC